VAALESLATKTAVQRLISNGRLRRSLLRGAWSATLGFMTRNPGEGVTQLRAAVHALTAPARQRIDILATRHVSYLAHVIADVIVSAGQQSRVFYDDEIFHDFGQQWVVLCPHVFARLPAHYIAFQLEQSVSSRWFTPACFQRLKQAQLVMEYSMHNVPFLIAHGIDANRIVHLPISTCADYLALLARAYPSFTVPTKKTVDVLFYGDPHSQRRQAFLTKLSQRFSIRAVDKVFGEKLQSVIASARLVVNIHYYENALLETTRLSETMSLGIPVVSETAADQSDHNVLNAAVRFTPMGDIDAMCDAVAQLLNSVDAYNAQLAAVKQLLGHDDRFRSSIVRFLHL
jgi:hypothetical protein